MTEVKSSTQLLRREEVAEKLAVSLRHADELILSKKLPSLKIGKRRLVTTDSLEAFVRKQERSAGLNHD